MGIWPLTLAPCSGSRTGSLIDAGQRSRDSCRQESGVTIEAHRDTLDLPWVKAAAGRLGAWSE